tara:strand:- start:59349 stop:62723 length:3375 start_codon:yes stop_codon:yes gene_type:complete
MSINYQWQVSKDGGDNYSNINYTGTILNLNRIKRHQDNNLYRCRVNRDGSAKYRYSNSAKLTVFPDISLGKLPSNISIDDGNLSLSPTVSVDNSATTSFQWQYSDNDGDKYYNLPSQTGSGLTLTGLSSANKNWLYKLKADSYYYSGIVNTVFSNAVKTNIETDVPIIQIWRQPQHYYIDTQSQEARAEFDVTVSSTGLDANGIPTTFFESSGISYAWERTIDNINWEPVATHPSGQNKLSIYDLIKDEEASSKTSWQNYYQTIGAKYRVNVSKDGHTVMSESASSLDGINLPETTNSDYSSKIYSMNHFHIRTCKGLTLGLFSNCPQILENKNRRINLKLLSLESNGDKYDLVLNMIRAPENNETKPYSIAIENVSLFKNNILQQNAVTNFNSSENKKTPFTINESAGVQSLSNNISAAGAGIVYGQGYCINLCNPLHGNNLLNANYKNFISNCIAKSSNKQYGAIKVGFTTTGSSSADTDLLSKLPTKIKIQNGNDVSVDLKISYEIIGSASPISKLTLSDIDVVILNQGYNWSSRQFTEAEQLALKYYVNDGGGLITSEWVLWNAYYGKFNHLKEVFAAEPNRYYKTEKEVRYYQYIQDSIINNNVEKDFKFGPANVAGGTETTLDSFKSKAQIFYIKDPLPMEIGLRESTFNILDLFSFTAKETENTTSVSLDGLSTFFEGSFHWLGKVDTDIKIGGALYWIYKSLIEHYRKAEPGTTKPNSVWSLGRLLVGGTTDGINPILKEYDYDISDFLFSESQLPSAQISPEQELTPNDNFWKDLSKLLGGLRPVNSYYRDHREIVKDSIAITKPLIGGTTAVKPVSGELSMPISVVSSSDLPISFTLQKASGESFEDAFSGTFNGHSIYISGIESSDIDDLLDRRVVFKTPLNDEGVSTQLFRFQSQGHAGILRRPPLNNQAYVQKLNHNGSGLFKKTITHTGVNGITSEGPSISLGSSGNLISWQYSYDDKNYYNIQSGGSISGTDCILTLNSGEYNKFIRYKAYPLRNNITSDNVTPTINSIAYSSSNLYDPQNDIFLDRQYNNYYTSGGVYYCDLYVSVENTNDTFTLEDITWEQYSSTTNTYSSVPNTSGHNVLVASGVKVALLDNYKFRAKINNRIFYT